MKLKNTTAAPRMPESTKQGVASKIAAKDPLGRLRLLGLTEPWQIALLLPHGWDDFTNPVSDFSALPPLGTRVLLTGKLAAEPKLRFDKVPRLIGYIADSAGRRAGFAFFGDTRPLELKLSENRENLAIAGEMADFNGRPWLRNAEWVSIKWAGKLRPKYPGIPKAIKAETVRDRALSMLTEAVPRASDWLGETTPDIGEINLPTLAGREIPFKTMASCLWAAHLPGTRESGELAQEILENIAAVHAIARAAQNRPEEPSRFRTPAPAKPRAKRLPFKLTPDQVQAVREILRDLAGESPMRRVLAGDVGTGKTAVYALTAAACLDGNGRACVLLPNSQLARQVARTIAGWWPELKDRMALVTNENTVGNPDKAGVIFGTTALLHRDTGEFDLVVVDEQQKFSRKQREKLLLSGSHLLEVTATCIPRSQALITYGIVDVSNLTTCHVEKHFHTRIWNQEERAELFRAVRESIAQGSQVLVIYPKRDTEGDEEKTSTDPAAGLPSAQEAFDAWNKSFPGRVRLAHGGLDDEENSGALSALHKEEADILVCTSIVETGINLPKVRRVVVMHPERLGLTQLHQLRGRAARTGGEGYCDLYCPRPIKEDSLKRLTVLTTTQNGFEIARQDLLLRGFGDLGTGSDRQSGADDTFLYGRPLRPAIIEAILSQKA